MYEVMIEQATGLQQRSVRKRSKRHYRKQARQLHRSAKLRKRAAEVIRK